MRKYPPLKDLVLTAAIALGGGVLYVPAAIGMGLAALLRRPEPADSGWRFTLAHVETAQTIAVMPRRRADLWAQMNLHQYFSMVPGPTAVARGYCAFSRAI